MSIGRDKQYDLTWEEQDQINRRREIRAKLKAEFTRLTFDPFLQMQQQVILDPGVERWMAMKKIGRLPGSPMPFRLFATWVCVVLLPIPLGAWWYKSVSEDLNRRINSGELKPEDREFKLWQS